MPANAASLIHQTQLSQLSALSLSHSRTPVIRLVRVSKVSSVSHFAAFSCSSSRLETSSSLPLPAFVCIPSLPPRPTDTRLSYHLIVSHHRKHAAELFPPAPVPFIREGGLVLLRRSLIATRSRRCRTNCLQARRARPLKQTLIYQNLGGKHRTVPKRVLTGGLAGRKMGEYEV